MNEEKTHEPQEGKGATSFHKDETTTPSSPPLCSELSPFSR